MCQWNCTLPSLMTDRIQVFTKQWYYGCHIRTKAKVCVVFLVQVWLRQKCYASQVRLISVLTHYSRSWTSHFMHLRRRRCLNHSAISNLVSKQQCHRIRCPILMKASVCVVLTGIEQMYSTVVYIHKDLQKWCLCLCTCCNHFWLS